MPGSDGDERHRALLSASIARSWYKTNVGWFAWLVDRLPDRNGCLSERVVTGQLLAGEAALDPLLHAFRQLAGLHQIQIQRLNVAEVEEVSLPFDLGVGIETEPAAADAVDLGLRVVRVGDDLLPEADDLALLVVDDDFLVRVLPVLETLHLQAEGDIANLVDADAHHIFLGTDVPAVRGVVGVKIGERLPVTGFLAVLVGLEPGLDPLIQFRTFERRHCPSPLSL